MRWGIILTAATKARLNHDTLLMGDLRPTNDGAEVLVFRDRFVALKVAARIGAERPVHLQQTPGTIS